MAEDPGQDDSGSMTALSRCNTVPMGMTSTPRVGALPIEKGIPEHSLPMALKRKLHCRKKLESTDWSHFMRAVREVEVQVNRLRKEQGDQQVSEQPEEGETAQPSSLSYTLTTTPAAKSTVSLQTNRQVRYFVCLLGF